MTKPALYAVLTGDLVDSTSQSSDFIAQAREEIEIGSQVIAGWAPGLLAGGPEFFRGDAWQLALSDPRFFLRASVYLRARLLALKPQADTRIAIGLGPIQRIEPQVSHSVGAAFTFSGRTLDDMKPWRLLAADANVARDGRMQWLPPLLSLCGAVVSRWKPKQAQIACLALDPQDRTQANLGKLLGLSQQGVSDAMVSAEFKSVMDAILYLESVPWDVFIAEDEA